MKTYELICDEHVVTGMFFYDEVLGSFFITDKIDYELTTLKNVDFVYNDNIINLVITKENKYNIYKVLKENKNVYVFAEINSSKNPNVEYLTLDDLNGEGLLTGGDVLEILAGVCKLPNGNYLVGNVQDYITTIEELTNKYKNYEYFFRGHYHYKYSLIPSLYRKKKYFDNESYMYMDFKTQFYNELSNKKYIEILTTMQYYKMPTRLLDTTSNPLVALYMACDKPLSYKNKNFGMGEVILMSEEKKNVKYSDSNAVTLLSSLAVLETNYKQELYLKFKEAIEKNDPSIYKGCLAYKRFVAEIANELPYFDDTFFDPMVLLKPRHVKVGMINERIIAQSGSFILYGLCDYKTGESYPLETVCKERIFIVNRPYISKQLEMLNINNGTMYPDKDHMSTVIVKSYD